MLRDARLHYQSATFAPLSYPHPERASCGAASNAYQAECAEATANDISQESKATSDVSLRPARYQRHKKSAPHQGGSS